MKAISLGHGVIFDQGLNQGIGRNHYDPVGTEGFAGPEERLGEPLGASRTSEAQGTGSTGVESEPD